MCDLREDERRKSVRNKRTLKFKVWTIILFSKKAIATLNRPISKRPSTYVHQQDGTADHVAHGSAELAGRVSGDQASGCTDHGLLGGRAVLEIVDLHHDPVGRIALALVLAGAGNFFDDLGNTCSRKTRKERTRLEISRRLHRSSNQRGPHSSMTFHRKWTIELTCVVWHFQIRFQLLLELLKTYCVLRRPTAIRQTTFIQEKILICASFVRRSCLLHEICEWQRQLKLSFKSQKVNRL